MTPSIPLSSDVQAELDAHGIPKALHPLFPQGLGGLIPAMGIHFSELSAEKSVATMPVILNTQPAGLLHGGASVALAETLGSLAAGVHGGTDRLAVGVDINATHLRPATSGQVTAVCTAVKLGRTICVHTIVITDELGRSICSARITNMLIPRPTRSPQ